MSTQVSQGCNPPVVIYIPVTTQGSQGNHHTHHCHDDPPDAILIPTTATCAPPPPSTSERGLLEQLLARLSAYLGYSDYSSYGGGNNPTPAQYGTSSTLAHTPEPTPAPSSSASPPPTSPPPTSGSVKTPSFEEVRSNLHQKFGGPNGLVNYIKEKTGTSNLYLKPTDVRLAADMETDPEKKAYLEFFYGNFGDIDKKKGQTRHTNGTDGQIGAGDIQEYFGWTGGSSQTR